MNIYTTRDEAIQSEILDPIEASGIVADAHAEFDVEMIADLVLEYDSINGREGFICKVDHDEFYAIVERQAL